MVQNICIPKLLIMPKASSASKPESDTQKKDQKTSRKPTEINLYSYDKTPPYKHAFVTDDRSSSCDSTFLSNNDSYL